jgi:AAA15 family ATPase/GTPase
MDRAMAEYLIDHIEIENFKCFKGFKAEKFSRVNLIAGKNNVGKTAFMEACFLSRANTVHDLYEKLLEIQTHRDIVNRLLLSVDRQQDLEQLIMNNASLSIYVKHSYKAVTEDEESGEVVDDSKIYCGRVEIEKNKGYGEFFIYTRSTMLEETSFHHNIKEYGKPEKYNYSQLINVLDMSLKNTKYRYSVNFISPYSNSNEELIDIVGQLKIDNKYDAINRHLEEIFNVSAIDIIKNEPMLKRGGDYYDLSTFGQGIKAFINIIGAMLLLEKDIIFIDEVENGIHYSHFDKLWTIILNLSKQQNIQVFATTHSKECIESYAKVAKFLANKEISYIKMTALKNGTIKASVHDANMLHYMLEDGHEVRGW